MPRNVLNSRWDAAEKDTCLVTLKAYLSPDKIYRVTLTFFRYYIKQVTFTDHDMSWE